MALQAAHFFNRVPVSDTASPAAGIAYVYLNPTTGRYVFSDSLIPAWTQVYVVTEGDGRLHLDTSPVGARVLARYGTTVQL